MADHGIFIGFGNPVRGREDAAARVFNEFVQYLAGQQQAGAIAGLGRPSSSHTAASWAASSSSAASGSG